jgi:hypothetical protein
MGSSMGGNHLLLLTTKGAKSGKSRTVPVMFFEDDGTASWLHRSEPHPPRVVQEPGSRPQRRLT